MLVQAGAKAVDESHGADVQRYFVHIRRTGTVGLQALRNNAQGDAQHHAQNCPVALQKIAQPFGHGEHPLAHRQAGEDVIGEVCRRLCHSPCVARGAHASTFAGEGDKVVVSAVITTGAGKAVDKDAAFLIAAR